MNVFSKLFSTSGSYRAASLLASTPLSSGTYRVIDPEAKTSLSQLSESARETFLSRFDPVRALGLNSETLVFRTTDKQFIKGGQMAGNPDSVARIGLPQELAPNPFIWGLVPKDAPESYCPRKIKASALGVPSLNVMVGPNARERIRGYEKSNHVTVQMRLGDFLAKGGKVYFDESSVVRNGVTRALIVTLPKGCKVPAKVLSN